MLPSTKQLESSLWESPTPEAVIAGKSENREYDFLVDTGATWVGIPQNDIDALGLETVPNASAALMTADGEVVNTPIYVGIGMLEGTMRSSTASSRQQFRW